MAEKVADQATRTKSQVTQLVAVDGSAASPNRGPYLVPSVDFENAAITPEQYGAVGDGTTDDTTALAAAIATGEDVDLNGLTYLISSDIPASNSGQRIFNGTIKSTSSDEIQVLGTTGNSSDVYEDQTAGEETIKVATKAQFSADDWVVVKDNDDLLNNATKGTARELAQVVSVDATPGDHDILTLDRALQHDYTVTGSSAVPTVTATTIVEDWEFDASLTGSVSIDIQRARRCRINIRSCDATPIVHGLTDTCACDDLDIRIRAEDPVGSGSNNWVRLIGLTNSLVDVNLRGGAGDGLRLNGCANVRARAVCNSIEERALHMYRCAFSEVHVSITSSPPTGSGNIEQVLIDYCNDCTVTPQILLWEAGDAVEIRGTADQITILNCNIFAADETLTTPAINLHGSGQLQRNITIRGGHVRGGQVEMKEQVDNLLIEGLFIEPHPDSTGFQPIRLGSSLTADVRSGTIRNCYIISENGNAILANDQDSGGYVFSNYLIEGNTFDFMSTASSQQLRFDDVDGLIVRGNANISATSNRTYKFDTNTSNVICRRSENQFGANPTILGAVDDVSVTPEQYGAVGNGVTDDTAAFAAALAAANGGMLEVPPNKSYDLATWTTVTLSSDTEIRIGEGTTITGTGRTGDAFVTAGNAAKVTIRGGAFSECLSVVTVANITSGTHPGIHLEGVSADDCSAMVTDGGSANHVATAGLVMRDCVVNDCNFGARFRAIARSLVTIEGCRFTNISDDAAGDQSSAIVVGDNSSNDDNGLTFVSGNYINNVYSSASVDTHGIIVFGSPCKIVNNHVENISNAGGADSADDSEGIYTKSRHSVIHGNTLINAGYGEGCIADKGVADGAGSAPEGYGSRVTDNTVTGSWAEFTTDFATDDKLTFAENAPPEGMAVWVVSDNTLPTGLTASTTYYSINRSADGLTCELSTTRGGSAVELTADGTGPHHLQAPDAFIYCKNEESVITGNRLDHCADGIRSISDGATITGNKITDTISGTCIVAKGSNNVIADNTIFGVGIEDRANVFGISLEPIASDAENNIIRGNVFGGGNQTAPNIFAIRLVEEAPHVTYCLITGNVFDAEWDFFLDVQDASEIDVDWIDNYMPSAVTAAKFDFTGTINRFFFKGILTGTPESNLAASIGSMVHRVDGGASTSLYVKESGVGNTGWAAK